MKLVNREEFESYVKNNLEHFITLKNDTVKNEIKGRCDVCKRDAYLKIHSQSFRNVYYNEEAKGLCQFKIFNISCPSCSRQSFIHTVEFSSRTKAEAGQYPEFVTTYDYYRLFRLPTAEESFANKDIPEEHESLKKTLSEADYCLSHSKFIAATILYRRSLQILVKDILQAKGKTLFHQLEWLTSNPNAMEIDLTNVFHENSSLIKDIGNQGAHPDKDITLHDFTEKDAYGLHDLFISIIHEVFVKPKKMEELQEELKKSRKLQ